MEGDDGLGLAGVGGEVYGVGAPLVGGGDEDAGPEVGGGGEVGVALDVEGGVGVAAIGGNHDGEGVHVGETVGGVGNVKIEHVAGVDGEFWGEHVVAEALYVHVVIVENEAVGARAEAAGEVGHRAEGAVVVGVLYAPGVGERAALKVFHEGAGERGHGGDEIIVGHGGAVAVLAHREGGGEGAGGGVGDDGVAQGGGGGAAAGEIPGKGGGGAAHGVVAEIDGIAGAVELVVAHGKLGHEAGGFKEV